MSGALQKRDDFLPSGMNSKRQELVTARIGGQLFGIAVMTVQDVLRKQRVASVPLAESRIAGLINMRGRIVTVLDMRNRFSLPSLEGAEREKAMHVVVEYRDEMYSLMVDKVGEVMSLALDNFEKVPANTPSHWKQYSMGVFKLEKELLIILDVDSVIGN